MLSQSLPRFLFAAGGTGGHVYPAIAIADAIKDLEPRAAIEFAGTRERMEWEAVPKAGYAIQAITVAGFHRKQLLRNVSFPFKLLKGFSQSLGLVRGFNPDVVVGTGGFVAGPVLLAASLKKRAVALQEQNAFAGMTNRLLRNRADQIHIAFPEAKAYFPEEKCILSGNPTRAELLQADRTEGRQFFDVPEEASLLFMFGGSLGSAALNVALAEQLEALLAKEDLYVIWQTGKLYYDRYQERIAEHPRLRMLKYVERMDLAYAASDLVLSRAGAITCSELMVTGTPVVLVPSPNVAEDHQTQNARSLVDAGAAVLLPEPQLKTDLVNTIHTTLQDVDRRRKMKTALLTLARPNAATEIARHLLNLAGWIPNTHSVSPTA